MNHHILDVTPANVSKTGIMCLKSGPGAKKKIEWFNKRYEEGLRFKIVTNVMGDHMGFIEYIPAEYAWRPVDADNYLFIHCIAMFSKKGRNQNAGSALIQACEEDAKAQHKHGVCTMTSKGAWMANESVFSKNGYSPVDTLDRFELVVKKWNDSAPDPKLIDWKKQQAQYQGWHLLYAHQCPWHEKSIHALYDTARAHGIDLQVTELTSSAEVKQGPSGFGTFSLICDGRLIEDHYLSKKRFENILKKELNL